MKGEGGKGEVGILFMIVRRAEIDSAVDVVKKHNPNASYTIEDVRSVRESETKIKAGIRICPIGLFWLF